MADNTDRQTFFRASKANAHIVALCDKIDGLEKKILDLSGDDSDAIKAAEAATAKLAITEAGLTASQAEADSLKAQLAKANADLKAASEDTDKKAAALAAKIVASSTQPPVAGKPSGNEEKPWAKLTGLAKAIAIEQHETALRNARK